MKWVWILVFVALSCVFACSSKEKMEKEEDDEKESSREVDAKYQAVAEKFGKAFVDKDWMTGYYLLSDEMQHKTSFNDFVNSVSEYRNAFTGEIKVHYKPSDDPQEMPEFVAESERRYLVENITMEFEGKMEDSEGEESFFCTLWIINNGKPAIGRFYLED